MCSQNKQRLLPCTTLTSWFLKPSCRVFAARYGVSPYTCTTQIRFVFEVLIMRGNISVNFSTPLLSRYLEPCLWTDEYGAITLSDKYLLPLSVGSFFKAHSSDYEHAWRSS
jgi:hypothetical protein